MCIRDRARSIGIPFSAAAAATDTASASPVTPFTTAISDTSYIPSNLLAIARAVSSHVDPIIPVSYTHLDVYKRQQAFWFI